jgi:hypothetical protein
MRIAITAETGFAGRRLGRVRATAGHDIVPIARGLDVRARSAVV